jgi:hypothetical protein
MQSRWMGLALTAAGISACSAGTSQTGGQGLQVTPTVSFTQSILCMEQALRDRDYRIVSLDKRDGMLQAQRAQEQVKLSNPRQYGAGDQIDVKPAGKPKEGLLPPLIVTPSGYVLEWLPNGSSTSVTAPSDSAMGDAKYLVEHCAS